MRTMKWTVWEFLDCLNHFFNKQSRYSKLLKCFAVYYLYMDAVIMIYKPIYRCGTERTHIAWWKDLSVSQRDSGNQWFGKDRQFAGIGFWCMMSHNFCMMFSELSTYLTGCYVSFCIFTLFFGEFDNAKSHLNLNYFKV